MSTHRWNGNDDEAPEPHYRTVTLTKRGMIAAICAEAEPFTVRTVAEVEASRRCPVTVYDTVAVLQERGVRTTKARACGEPARADGLCDKHAADRERLL